MKKILALIILALSLGMATYVYAADQQPAPEAPAASASTDTPEQTAAPAPQTSSKPGMFSRLSHFFSKSDDGGSDPSHRRGRGGRGADLTLPPKMNVDRKADAKNLEVAREIVKLVPSDGADRRERGLRRPMLTITGVVIPQVAAENSGKEDKVQKISADVLAKIDAKHAGDEQEDRAIAYAQTFTYSELEQLKNFYESSAGKKLIRFSNELSATEVQLKQDSAVNKAYEARAALISEFKKNSIEVPKEIAQ